MASTTRDGTAARGGSAWPIALATMASMMVALDLLVVAAALRPIQEDLGVRAGALPWVATAYAIPFAAFLLLGAALGDRFGRPRVLASALLCFVVASAACALAPSIGWLVAARSAQGAAAAAVIPVAVAVVIDVVDAAARGRALGTIEGLTGLATAAGPVVGGLIASALSWRWIFWVNVPIGLTAAALALLTLPAGARRSGVPIDVLGGCLAAGTTGALVFAATHGASAGWNTGPVVAAAVASAVLGRALVVRLRRARSPLIPRGLLRDRRLITGLLATVALFGSLYGTVYFSAQYFQVAHSVTPAEAGLRLLPWTATLFLVAPLAGALADRIGESRVLAAGLALQAGGLAWLAVNVDSPYYLESLLPLLVAGVGASAAIPAVQSLVLGAGDASTTGPVSGLNSSAQELGGAFGVAAVVVAFSAVGDYGSPGSFTDGVGAAFAVAACLSVAALAVQVTSRSVGVRAAARRCNGGVRAVTARTCARTRR